MENLHKLPILLLLLAFQIVLPSTLILLLANYIILPKLNLDNISFVTALSFRLLMIIAINTTKATENDKLFKTEEEYRNDLYKLFKVTAMQYVIFVVIFLLKDQ